MIRTSRVIRLGLRQFAAGMLSILVLGILNRVMKVEMGLPLGLIGRYHACRASGGRLGTGPAAEFLPVRT